MRHSGRTHIGSAIDSTLSSGGEASAEALAEAIGAAVASACGCNCTNEADALRVEDRARRVALGVLRMYLGTGEHELR